MKFTIDISMKNTEGALERLLGRLRQRSFAVCDMSAGCTDNFAKMSARITVESTRSPELALKQLGKLIDVERVNLLQMEGEQHVFSQMQKQ